MARETRRGNSEQQVGEDAGIFALTKNTRVHPPVKEPFEFDATEGLINVRHSLCRHVTGAAHVDTGEALGHRGAIVSALEQVVIGGTVQVGAPRPISENIVRKNLLRSRRVGAIFVVVLKCH